MLFSDVERGASAVSAPAGVLRVGFARGVSEREVRDACAEAFNREGVAFSVEEENGQLCAYVPAPACWVRLIGWCVSALICSRRCVFMGVRHCDCERRF